MSTTCSLPKSFLKKKAQVLADIGHHDSSDYSDKSPKGTIDSEIIDLIHEINTLDHYVTTSSCAGRVAVFVEGRKASLDDASGAGAGPGGKGHGNKWLYVSHSPVNASQFSGSLHDLFKLQPKSVPPLSAGTRLIKLSFSPLILHVFCSDLHSAKNLLAAAINAAFRESGVQSLKALDDSEAGAMIGIRTAGLAFEAVIGFVDEGDGEIYKSCVDEEFLKMCVLAVDERFKWNRVRKERLREDLKNIHGKGQDWEDKDVRRARKRAEGLTKQREALSRNADADGADALDDGLLVFE